MKNEIKIKALAEELNKLKDDYNICIVSPIIAQAILETGWLADTNPLVKVYNYFGLKCGKIWNGKRLSCKTFEYVGNVKYYTQDDFRAYDSLADGARGYFEFINWSNYANLKNVKDYKVYCRNLQNDGYATAPDYAVTLISIIEDYKLYLFDSFNEKEYTESMSKEKKVALLQAMLNACGYDCGTVDGIYGKKTDTAVNKLLKDIKKGD